MATLHTAALNHHHQHHHQPQSQSQPSKITKTRARTSVKPILKKLHSSHSEKNSLDLDRSWEQQSAGLGFTSADHSTTNSYNFNHGYSYSGDSYAASGRSTRDVSFTISSADLDRSCSGAGLTTSTTASTVNSSSAAAASATCASSGNLFSVAHARSTSGASHISTATSTSGRNGSFVHPFQQTPRTSTPPLLSFANSQTSLDNGTRDSYSPTTTIDEDVDDSVEPLSCQPTDNASAVLAKNRALQTTIPPSHSNSNRPSFSNSRRSSSLSENQQSLRLATTRTTSSGAPPRRAHTSGSVNQGRSSDTHLTTGSVTIVSESSFSPTSIPNNTTPVVGSYSPQLLSSPISPSTSTSPMSPLRSSLDGAFRIRSRSEVDTATRQEHVRQARRKFEEKEKAKKEKYAREQLRKRERTDSKEAHRHERAHTRNGSFGTTGISSARNSTSVDIRPTPTRKSTSTSVARFDGSMEKKSVDVINPGYHDLEPDVEEEQLQPPPSRADEVHFEPNKRSKTAKRKTQSGWTAFTLWLRTRMVKLGRR